MDQNRIKEFPRLLQHWHRYHNRRDMPWKGIRDPYRIWLSEIILQQTRVEQGLPYYLELTTQYPDVHHLARADEKEVYRIWQGLGYYNRCRNMLETARHISANCNGRFPDTPDALMKLKGIGPYTAAAIASFAFHYPSAVVDGNVIRVLSRVFAVRWDEQKPEGKKKFAGLASACLDIKRPHRYNQAIMDLGATVCLPAQALCDPCPLKAICLASQRGQVKNFPLKKKKKPLQERVFHFFVYKQGRSVFLTLRPPGDIWAGLYSFPYLETPVGKEFPAESLHRLNTEQAVWNGRQTLSHQRITGYFYLITLSAGAKPNEAGLIRVEKKKLESYPFPKLLIDFLKNSFYL